jgi:FAS-associated factor 2
LLVLACFAWSHLVDSYDSGTADPFENVIAFIDEFKRKYGDQHPNFYRGSYPQALTEAKRELRFLLVYLHNELHQNTFNFCQTVLIHKEVVNYISRNNIICWACSIDSPEGYRVSQALRENTYPFLALIVLKDNHMTVVRKFEGQTTVERLLR